MSTTGVVLSVDVERYGDTLAAATLATDVVLQVEDVVDFADEDDFAAGPQWLTVGGSAPKQYVSVDDEADTVTLAAAIGTAYEAGEPVRMWDAAAGDEVVSHVAWVELDEADDNDAPIPVEVRHDEMIFFGLDNLAALIGARVVIEEDDDDPEAWHIAHVVGRVPVLDGTYIEPGTIPDSGPGQTFSQDEPTITDGYPEGHAWWQVVDGDVLGFWRLEAGAWVPAEIVTADALVATNALIEALQVVDLSTVNLQAVNIDGGSIYIAQSASAEYPRAFSGTTLPDGWTASQTVTGTYVAPDPAVIDTGLPAGGDGSALFFDTGAAGQTDGSSTLKVVPDYDVQNFELLMKYQLDLPSDEPLPPTMFAVGMCVSGDDRYRLSITGTTVGFHEVINGSAAAAAVSQSVPWIDGSWYWVRVRKAGGSVTLSAWPDGDVEPTPKTSPLSTALPAGDVEIVVSASTFLGPSDGQKVWVDQFDVTTLTTGFQVNPDGTGDWPHLRELLLESFQSGTVSSGTFAAVDTEKTIDVTFPVPFESVPDVQLTLETTHSPVNLYPPVKRNVTTTGFTIAVARSNALGSVDISWSASVS